MWNTLNVSISMENRKLLYNRLNRAIITITTIQTIVRSSNMQYKESFSIELKRELNHDFKKEIIAFANSDGGEIFVGVDKDGTPTGVNDTESVMEAIGNMIRDGIRPDLTAYTSIECIENNVIRVEVLRGTKRPYHLTDKGLKPTGVFIRHGVSSVPATEEVIRQLIRESDGTYFDKSRCVNQELTFEYTQKYFDNANLKFEDNNKRTLGIIDADGYYTNSALLFSDQCEHSIKCAIYEGTGKTEFKARKEFTGSILKQMDEAFEYINVYNKQNSSFENLKRVDHHDYPLYAIREALLNAIVHRDYDYSGSILVNIYDNRIEFVSIGGLVKGITVKDIMNGISQPRNSVIANVFYRLELIESYGTGIQRILESYSKCSVQPTFTPSPASFVVMLPNTKYNSDSEMTDEEKVLSLFEEKNEISRKDIETVLSCTKSAAIGIINKLISEDRIIKNGAARAVRYKLK